MFNTSAVAYRDPSCKALTVVREAKSKETDKESSSEPRDKV